MYSLISSKKYIHILYAAKVVSQNCTRQRIANEECVPIEIYLTIKFN